MYVHSAQINSSMCTWIIDSYATHHFTPYRQLLVNVQNIQYELLLPNGQKACVTHARDVILNSSIVLSSVCA